MNTTACDLPGASRSAPHEEFPESPIDLATPAEGGNTKQAVLAGGCFWCTEAVYRQLDGVLSVTSGYSGGDAETADYRTVCSGLTRHAEAIRIEYDPARISYGRLLKVFFMAAHDPTQLNRQGNDHGPQYRSAVFYADEEERRVAQAYIEALDAAKIFRSAIATTLEPLQAIYEAEAYPQDYARQNPFQPYIAAVSAPKVDKVRRYFSDQLKPDNS